MNDTQFPTHIGIVGISIAFASAYYVVNSTNLRDSGVQKLHAKKISAVISLTSDTQSRLFGNKLISLRSLIASAGISITLYILFVILARLFSGTESIDEYIRATNISGPLTFSFYFNFQYLHYLNPFANYEQTILIISLLVFIDYASVVETRYFFKKIKYDDKRKKVYKIIAIDFLTTTIIFIVLSSLIINCFVYYYNLRNADLYLDAHIAGYNTNANDNIILNIIFTCKHILFAIISHPINLFSNYESINFVYFSPSSLSEGLFDTKSVDIPLTTLIATTYATSVWIWLKVLSYFMYQSFLNKIHFIKNKTKEEINAIQISKSLIICIILALFLEAFYTLYIIQ